MALPKIAEVRKMSDDDIADAILNAKKKLFELRLQQATRRLEKTHEFKHTRHRLGVSDKMDKTVVVAIENRSPHPKYGKIVVKTQKFKAHDAENQAKQGDRVRIRETRPLSKTKRWEVAEILTDS